MTQTNTQHWSKTMTDQQKLAAFNEIQTMLVRYANQYLDIADAGGAMAVTGTKLGCLDVTSSNGRFSISSGNDLNQKLVDNVSREVAAAVLVSALDVVA
jgi:hypothetical protein